MMDAVLMSKDSPDRLCTLSASHIVLSDGKTIRFSVKFSGVTKLLAKGHGNHNWHSKGVDVDARLRVSCILGFKERDEKCEGRKSLFFRPEVALKGEGCFGFKSRLHSSTGAGKLFKCLPTELKQRKGPGLVYPLALKYICNPKNGFVDASDTILIDIDVLAIANIPPEFMLEPQHSHLVHFAEVDELVQSARDSSFSRRIMFPDEERGREVPFLVEMRPKENGRLAVILRFFGDWKDFGGVKGCIQVRFGIGFQGHSEIQRDKQFDYNCSDWSFLTDIGDAQKIKRLCNCPDHEGCTILKLELYELKCTK